MSFSVETFCIAESAVRFMVNRVVPGAAPQLNPSAESGFEAVESVKRAGAIEAGRNGSHLIGDATSFTGVEHGGPVHEAGSHEVAFRVRRRPIEKVCGLTGNADNGPGQDVTSVPCEQEEQFRMTG